MFKFMFMFKFMSPPQLLANTSPQKPKSKRMLATRMLPPPARLKQLPRPASAPKVPATLEWPSAAPGHGLLPLSTCPLLVQHVVRQAPLAPGAAKDQRSQLQVAQRGSQGSLQISNLGAALNLCKTIWLRGSPSAKPIAAAVH